MNFFCQIAVHPWSKFFAPSRLPPSSDFGAASCVENESAFISDNRWLKDFDTSPQPSPRSMRRGRRVEPRLRGLRAVLRRRNLSAMSTISVSDLQKKPAKQWLKSAGREDLVITSKGQPVAVLMRIAAASVESTRALLRSVRALQAQSALQQSAVASGASELSMSDIDAEIAASRRARRRK